jgi:long-chain acyl-CoA synthetase
MTTMFEPSTTSAWGTGTARATGGAIPFVQYEPRRHRLPELLVEATRWDGRDHLVQGERRLTYRRFLEAVDSVAGDLRRRGVRPGDRVLLLAANSPEWVVSFWAALRSGAVLAPGNGWWSEGEVDHAVRLVEPALVIGDPRRLAKVPPATPTMEIAEVQSLVDSAPRGAAIDDGEDAGEEHDPALIVFTSGTTGLPKGATLAHRSVIANLHNLLAVSGRLPHQLRDDQPGVTSLLSGPLFHIGGIQAMCLALVTGGTLVFLEGRFDPHQVLDLIERERVDVWGAVPTMAMRVLDDPSLPGRDLTSVRSISLGGAPVPPELVGRLRAAYPNADRGISTVYGMTETGGTVAAASGAVMARHPGTSGRPLAVVELRIDQPDDRGVGEILVRTPGQMLGYWGDAETGVIDAEGFVHTGDLGRLDEGLLHLTGRSKDIVIRGGENIAAPHVEAMLLEHPGVSSVAVVGLHHAELGEEVGAAVVARRGSTLDAESLAAFLSGRLAHFEIPTRWWLWTDQLPANDAGKVDKRRLRETWPPDSA